ncbi:MAG TPA: cytochrome c oxidase subunit II [Thermoanaerobaculia bacterium]|nr:cytochrome c oxidase subunit II [Thermoanaerobaculia bacterium]
MRVEIYERIWMYLGGLMIAGFLAVIVSASIVHAVHPPSHVETIDPAKVATDPDFSRPRVEKTAGGAVLVVGTAEMFAFKPDTIRVPRGKPVTFRLTSPDVVHGFEIVGTNANAMILPGYVTQFTVAFPRAGEYLLVCNEYCGLAHHLMQGKLIVEESAR